MEFVPTLGHEQTGLWSAVVISKDKFNKYMNMVIRCNYYKY